MTDLLQVVLLSLVQGLTEFLPISSSAHLILLPLIAHFPDQGLAFDVAVHFGTLIAVLFYFRRKIKWLLIGFFKSFKRPKKMPFYGKLAWLLMFASIPIALSGALFHHLIESVARSPLVIAGTTIFFGILLLVADIVCKTQKPLQEINLKSALIIGGMQILALIPGTSRSGITLTGGLFLGFNKRAAATFSFLLAIPAILMAGGYESLKLLHTTSVLPWYYFLIGVSISAISAFFCIHFFLQLINKIGLLPFVIYRIILGLVLIYVFI